MQSDGSNVEKMDVGGVSDPKPTPGPPGGRIVQQPKKPIQFEKVMGGPTPMKCPSCDGEVKGGNKYCSWKCGSEAKRFGKAACANQSCPDYGMSHPNCQCGDGIEKSEYSDMTMLELLLISKAWTPVIGPRGKPGMKNTETNQVEYGHNAERIAHVKEHGDLRFDDEGKQKETHGKKEHNREPGYTQVRDLRKPHGHAEPGESIDKPYYDPSPVSEKSADPGVIPPTTYADPDIAKLTKALNTIQ